MSNFVFVLIVGAVLAAICGFAALYEAAEAGKFDVDEQGRRANDGRT